MDGPAPGRGLAARAPEAHDMHIDPFELERWQSLHEHHTAINLAESGVHPLRVGELAAGADRDALLDQALEYTQTNGTAALRDRIAALYDGASAANVLVTNGSAEGEPARLLATHRAGRRGRRRPSRLHADTGPAPIVRGDGARGVARAGAGGVAPRPRRGARGGRPPHPVHRRLQPQQPDGGAPRRDGAGGPRRDRGPPRVLAARRRGLPRGRARRPRHAVGVGRGRTRAGDRRAVEGLRPAGPAHRVAGGTGRADRRPVDTPRLHVDRPRGGQRPARPAGPRAAAPPRAARTHPAHPCARTRPSWPSGPPDIRPSASSRRRREA